MRPLILFGDGQEGVLDSLLVKGKQLNWRKTEDSTLFEKAVLSLNAGPTVVYRHTQWVPNWAHTPVQEEATTLRMVAAPVALAVIKAPHDTSTSALESLKGSLVKLATIFQSNFYVFSTDKVVRRVCESQLVHIINKIGDIVDPLEATNTLSSAVVITRPAPHTPPTAEQRPMAPVTAAPAQATTTPQATKPGVTALSSTSGTSKKKKKQVLEAMGAVVAGSLASKYVYQKVIGERSKKEADEAEEMTAQEHENEQNDI